MLGCNLHIHRAGKGKMLASSASMHASLPCSKESKFLRNVQTFCSSEKKEKENTLKKKNDSQVDHSSLEERLQRRKKPINSKPRRTPEEKERPVFTEETPSTTGRIYFTCVFCLWVGALLSHPAVRGSWDGGPDDAFGCGLGAEPWHLQNKHTRRSL